MRRWLWPCLFVLVPCVSSAGVVTPPSFPGSCSRIPARIILVGSNGTRPDTRLGSFEVTVCRFTNPAAGATVMIGSSQTPAGVRLGRDADPTQEFASCSSPFLRAYTNASGFCRMTVTGTVELADQQPGIPPTVSVYANGVLFGNVPVVCYDLDGASGVGANDMSLWFALFGTAQEFLVADYNGTGTVDADDLSMWLDVFGSGGDVESATPICP